jgi:hypothetical protein
MTPALVDEPDRLLPLLAALPNGEVHLFCASVERINALLNQMETLSAGVAR